MKKQRVNRQIITRTGRICFSTACVMILASCAAKPIAQDLPSGDGTVAIKYLDSVTVDIIDDIRMKRRDFYQEALDNRRSRYSQGTQGAVDRVSTFAAAINANAQRDKSVLERYHADGDRQLSALENSEELGDALLDHNKELISQAGALNDAKVKVAESGAALTEGVNTATIEGYSTVISGYQSTIEENKKELADLKEEKEALDSEIAGLDAGEDKVSKNNELREIEAKIASINGPKGTLTEAINSLNLLVSGRITATSLADNGLAPSGVNDPLTTTGMKIMYDLIDGELQEDGSGGYKIKEATATKVDISQVPQAAGPAKNETLGNAVSNLDSIKKAMENLADSNSSDALNKTRKLSAPPIERVRNDEAVFDYLLDGYRNTQISSGAEYGGVVRRVLPFSFTFNPGKDSQSGFGARVVLRPDDKDITLASKVLKKHITYVNQDRISEYMQRYRDTQVKVGRNPMMLLLSSSYAFEWINSKMDTFYEEFKRGFYNYDKEGQEVGLKNSSFVAPSNGQFWQAYRVSLDTIRRALEKGDLNAGKHYYQYNPFQLKTIAKRISKNISALKVTKRVTDILKSSMFTSAEKFSAPILGYNTPASNQEQAARSSARQLSASIAKLVKPGSQLSEWREKEGFYEVMDDINKLAMTMTSAGLVFDLYLQSNPLFFPAAKDCLNLRQGSCEDKTKNTITIIPDGSEYLANLYQVTVDDVKPLVEAAAQPRIVENTSREHVVEIADTAKINTLLSAAVQGNEVSEQLGLTLGAELAAAVSSSSAFIKRIPYAVPVNGQDSGNFFENKEHTQTFGWRYYKTPAGVTQLGGIAQTFKTTPLNSSVVVTMPEWMSTLTAEYQISPNGDSDWKSFGTETIAFSGAAIRGALSDRKMHSFDTWVKYHIYKEVDSVGLPVMKSCIVENDTKKVGLEGGHKDVPIISGSRGGEMAICGENLYGVKGIIVGGQYIHGEIQKVSSNLIHLKTSRFKTLQNDNKQEKCAETSDPCARECEIALLSDFGVSDGAVGCLQFVSVADEVAEATGGKNVSAKVNVQKSFNSDEAKITLGVEGFKDSDRVERYRVNVNGEDIVNKTHTSTPISVEIPLSKIVNKCLNKSVCSILTSLYVVAPEENARWVDIYPTDAIDLEEYLGPFYEVTFEHHNDPQKITISGYEPLVPETLFIGDPDQMQPVTGLIFGKDSTTNTYKVDVTKEQLDEICGENVSKCRVQLQFKRIDKRTESRLLMRSFETPK